MKRLAPAIVLFALALLVASGCGDGGDTTTIIQSPSTVSTDASTTPAAAAGPRGELTATGIGEVRQGVSKDEAIALFGEPTREDRFPGCKLNPDDQPREVLTYDLEDGSLSLDFGASDGEMLSYRTTSPSFPTSLGDRVGDTYASLESNWGASLKPLDLGVPSTAEAGYWFVKESTESQLQFDIAGGEIKTIFGGSIPICE